MAGLAPFAGEKYAKNCLTFAVIARSLSEDSANAKKSGEGERFIKTINLSLSKENYKLRY